MGYYMDQVRNDFKIKKENFDAALAALKSVFVKENMTCYDWDGIEKHPHFAWVDTDTVLNSKTLEDALYEIRWESFCDDNGDIDSIIFIGEKSGDEDVFFNAIAPYVVDGSYIEMIGEDSYQWRWVFHNGICEEKTPIMIWN